MPAKHTAERADPGREPEAEPEATVGLGARAGAAAAGLALVAACARFAPLLAALYVLLCTAYFWGSEIAFQRLQSWADAVQSAAAYTLHFLWGLGIPLALLALRHGWSCPPVPGAFVAALLFAACGLTWCGLGLRFFAIADMGAEYDRRIELGVGRCFGTLGAGENGGGAALNQRGESETGTRGADGRQKKKLVTRGCYELMRHPGFAAHILQQVGNGLFASGCFALLAPADAGASSAAFALTVLVLSAVQFGVSHAIFSQAAASEEQEILGTASKDEYAAYMRRVPLRFRFSATEVLLPMQAKAWRGLTRVLSAVVGGTSEALQGFAKKVREGNSRQIFLQAVGVAQGVTIQYVDPIACPAVVSKMLCATGDKGTFVEDLIACKAWPPVVSVESVPETISRRMRGKLQKFMAQVKLDSLAEEVAKECVEMLKDELKNELASAEAPVLTRTSAGEARFDNPTISRLTFKIFFRLLTRRSPTEAEHKLMQEAVDDWKAEIALKRPSVCTDKYDPQCLRMRFIAMIAAGIHEEPALVRQALAEDAELRAQWQPTLANLEDLSCILQPLMISPIINIGDILSALKNCIEASPAWHQKVLDASQKDPEQALKLSDMVLLELIRVQHPFPILERYIERDMDFSASCPMTGAKAKTDAPHPCPFIKAGTQVLVEYDQLSMSLESDFDPERWRAYVDAGREYEAVPLDQCPYKPVPFGQGPRRCPGQKVARAILRHLVRFVLVEFTPGDGWVRFRPTEGHKWSGRNNDGDEPDSLHIVKKLGGILAESAYIGLKRRTVGV